METSPSAARFEQLFAQHRTAAIPDLWPWQREILASLEAATGDLAIDLPTGTGKTLVGLLAGEDFRLRSGGPVAYVAGNKQLAAQVERQGRQQGIPVVRFQGSKDSWDRASVLSYNFGEAIGVMNYWNYFNASPGLDPAGLLILDDVHLLEQPLRDMYTVAIRRSDPVYEEVLGRIVGQCPYYALAADLLNGLAPPSPPEMVVFPDSAELASGIRDLLDSRLIDGTTAWWAWQQIRSRLEVCCWLISSRAVTFAPYIPPSQTLAHFATPARRIYMSATIGTVDDLRRRLGAPPLEKLSATVQPRQGDRLVLISDAVEAASGEEAIETLRPLLTRAGKALWLCARRDTAAEYVQSLQSSGLPGSVRLLEGDNGADEAFAAAATGHLVAAGRYDGMDFRDDACRVEVLPEIPIATSDLEEWTSAYLRDAGFADARFSQRVAQSLGRCNRSETDRAVYILFDPEFSSRLSERRTVDLLSDDVRADIFAALRRTDDLGAQIALADRFLDGEDVSPVPAPARLTVGAPPSTGGNEVDGFLALWRENYRGAARIFDTVALDLGARPEHRAFWLAMRALALRLAGEFGDHAAAAEATRALAAASTAGAHSTFFTRLRHAQSRLAGRAAEAPRDGHDEVFSAWDVLVQRYGATGPRFERWSATLLDELGSDDHDTVARSIARFGAELLGLAAQAPQATSGEHDAEWEFAGSRRTLTFEVKLAPVARRVVNDDVEQAEGATKAVEARRRPARGLLVTPWLDVDRTALERLDRVRLIQRENLVLEARSVMDLLLEYRRGWDNESASRADRRRAVEPHLPPIDWLWRAHERSDTWVDPDALIAARRR
jgi:hypothetical protein